MKTKEEKASEYAKKNYPKVQKNDEEIHKVSSFKAKDNCIDDFLAGYEAAEKDAREKAVRVHSKFCHFKIDDKCRLSDFHTECSLIPNCNYKTNFINHYNNETEDI